MVLSFETKRYARSSNVVHRAITDMASLSWEKEELRAPKPQYTQEDAVNAKASTLVLYDIATRRTNNDGRTGKFIGDEEVLRRYVRLALLEPDLRSARACGSVMRCTKSICRMSQI